MLQRVDFRNFRCFRHVRADLRPFTVLIGENDTGKSSFLAGVHRLSQPEFSPDERQRGDTTFVGWALNTGHQIALSVRDGRQGPVEQILPMSLYTLPTSGVNLHSGGMAGIPQLDQLGNNIPALIDYFIRKDRPRFDAFVKAMRERVPGLEDINVDTPDASSRVVEVKVDGGRPMQGNLLSAGVRLMFFFVALAHHPQLPKIILIEEPENGLHPKRLADVVRLLRGLTEGTLGGAKAQVILTTHSPLVLDEVNLDKDQVLVFKRESDGARTVQPVDRDRLKVFLDEFKLGEVWVNKDEQALIKKTETAK